MKRQVNPKEAAPKKPRTYFQCAEEWTKKFGDYVLTLRAARRDKVLTAAIKKSLDEIEGPGHLAYLNDKYIRPHIERNDGTDYIVDDWLIWLKVPTKDVSKPERQKLGLYLMALSELFATFNVQFSKEIFVPSEELKTSIPGVVPAEE